jgi:hypothetical protein
MQDYSKQGVIMNVAMQKNTTQHIKPVHTLPSLSQKTLLQNKRIVGIFCA